MSARDVASPAEYWKLDRVLHSAGPGEMAVALGTWEGEPRIALRWNGSTNAWGDQTQTTAAIAEKSCEGFDIAFERASGHAFLIWGDPDSNANYKEFTTSWQSEQSAYSSLPDKVC